MSLPDYYAILSLSHHPNITPRELKGAYHRALLTHHPDKKNAPSGADSSSPPPSSCRPATAARQSTPPTVDEITKAYHTLASSSLRASYDRALLLSRTAPKNDKARHPLDESFRTGLETLDLDDLEYDDERELWFRACRCGLDRGFVVTGDELEKDEASGEVAVGCAGCSLWVKVLFGTADAENDAVQQAEYSRQNESG